MEFIKRRYNALNSSPIYAAQTNELLKLGLPNEEFNRQVMKLCDGVPTSLMLDVIIYVGQRDTIIACVKDERNDDFKRRIADHRF